MTPIEQELAPLLKEWQAAKAIEDEAKQVKKAVATKVEAIMLKYGQEQARCNGLCVTRKEGIVKSAISRKLLLEFFPDVAKKVTVERLEKRFEIK